MTAEQQAQRLHDIVAVGQHPFAHKVQHEVE
jgi:hypothetical protein